MKIAFLILAHDQPRILARLVDRLREPRASIYLHVDRKADLAEMISAISNPERLKILSGKERVSVHWSGYSTVRAILSLLNSAYGDGADRFALLSGSDYLTADVANICDRLAQDQEFIQVDREVDPGGDNWFDRCAGCVFLGDRSWLNPRSGNRHLKRLAEEARHVLPRRSFPFPVYFGSSWWCLTRDAVAEVLAPGRKAVLERFRYARLPEEMVFHTIVKSSSRGRLIAYDVTAGAFQGRPCGAANHYVDWDRPNPHAPRTLDLSDLESILASDALFIRKCDAVKSRTLLDALDGRLTAQAPSSVSR